MPVLETRKTGAEKGCARNTGSVVGAASAGALYFLWGATITTPAGLALAIGTVCAGFMAGNASGDACHEGLADASRKVGIEDNWNPAGVPGSGIVMGVFGGSIGIPIGIFGAFVGRVGNTIWQGKCKELAGQDNPTFIQHVRKEYRNVYGRDDPLQFRINSTRWSADVKDDPEEVNRRITNAAGVVGGVAVVAAMASEFDKIRGYVDQAQGYVKQAQGYQSKAQDYVKQAQDYQNKAQGYLKQAQDYTSQATDKAKQVKDNSAWFLVLICIIAFAVLGLFVFMGDLWVEYPLICLTVVIAVFLALWLGKQW